MIRNLFILGFAACLTGISRCDKDFGFKSTAYDDFDVHDEYQGSLRMHYKDFDSLDINEDQAELSRNVADTSEYAKDIEQEHPPHNATSSKKGMATATSAVTKTPVMNKTEKATNASAVGTNAANAMGSKTTNTKQTTNTKPGTFSTSGVNSNPPSKNGTNTKLPVSPKPAPKRRLVTIQYYLYNKDDNVDVEVNLPRFQPNKDVFIMLPGFMESQQPSYGQNDYIEDFFKSISSALIPYCNCTAIGVKWSFEPPRQPKPFIQYRAAIITGRRLGKAINEMRGIGAWNARLTIIGHDLGNLAAASLAGVLKRSPDYIYGLDQRLLYGNHKDFYLRQDLGRLVQTLTTNGMNYNYGHRNFYPNGGNFSSAFGPEGDCFFCHSYQLLSDDMTPNDQDHHSTFCTSYEDYVNDYCDNLSQVSYFNRYPANQLPIGNYFITEPVSQNQAVWD